MGQQPIDRNGGIDHRARIAERHISPLGSGLASGSPPPWPVVAAPGSPGHRAYGEGVEGSPLLPYVCFVSYALRRPPATKAPPATAAWDARSLEWRLWERLGRVTRR